MSTSELSVDSALKQTANAAVPTHLPLVEEADATGEVAEAYNIFANIFGRAMFLAF
jgi:hypothetical protein